MRFTQTKISLQEITAVADRIERAIFTTLADLKITAWTSREPLLFEDRRKGNKVRLQVGEKWGSLFDCAWFHFTGAIPPEGAGKEVVLLIDISGEGLVVSRAGEPAQGITTMASFYDFTLGRPGKRVVYLQGPFKGGEAVDLWVDGANNDLFGIHQNNGTVQQAVIAVLHSETQSLYYDYVLLLDFLKELPENSPRYQRILYALWRANTILIHFTPDEVQAARDVLASEIRKRNGDASLRMSAIGHAHLDLAWLWPMRETVRKGARTFSTVLTLMDRYPEYHFCASQAQLYQWMKDRYPGLFGRIKKRIEEGRWEPLGATWVEMDTNLPWGESMVRHFLYGKRFVKEEFGRDVRTLLLPDSFGYTGALPQIMRKAGVEYFVTTKLSWDRYNVYPHHTFVWEGIDGSRVLVHMPPEGTYNSAASPRAIRKAETEYLDKSVTEECLMLFGIGDGGGGPGIDHLERLRRERDLEGLAPVTQEPMERFLERLDKNRESYQIWSGELFLACHQGTYTTQGRNKRLNRMMEVELRDLEFVSVLAGIHAGAEYPHEPLEKIWKEVLLYQFHDILPGSSIGRVYEETTQRYEVLTRETADSAEEMYRRLQELINTSEFREPMTVFNSLSWERRDWQHAGKRWYHVHTPPLGYATLEATDNVTSFPTVRAEVRLLENDLLRIELDNDGAIRSIHDKELHREFLIDGSPANELIVYDDPYDAWEVGWDREYRRLGRFTLDSSDAEVNGPCASITNRYRYGKSEVIQRVVVLAGSRRIDFETEAHWQESHTMLRAVFPVNVRSGETTCEIQFGHIRRPTHRNTAWDVAKYEVPAHKWIDLSQRNYGVALLKQSKYGHSVSGNVLDIDLLRSPTYPDPAADLGRHEFTYALFPHPGDAITGDVIRAAYEFNYPLHVRAGERSTEGIDSSGSLLSLDSANVIVESVKGAETGGGIVVRTYEAHGIDCTAKLRFGFGVRSAWLTNLLEEEPQPVEVRDNAVVLQFSPFEIRTLKIEQRP